jgi:bacterioferritin (cytochrome b1)
MKYVLEILKRDLNEELRAKAVSKEVTAGNGFHFNNQTMEAFMESSRLADERIPQLEKAIEILSKI